jgi:hypothetical protein
MCGGLVYVTAPKEMEGKALRFSNICPSPTYVNNDTWSVSRKFDAPWGEIVTRYIVFTLPSEKLRQVDDWQPFVVRMDRIVHEMVVFLALKQRPRFRVVFDIDMPKDGSATDYPITMPMNLIDDVLIGDGPTLGLFQLLMKMAIISLPDGVLALNCEAALATLAAARVFVKIWPEASPFDYVHVHMTPIFNSLWDVYTRNDGKMIPMAFAKWHEAVSNNPNMDQEEAMKMLVNEMASIVDKDFSSVLTAMLESSRQSADFPDYNYERGLAEIIATK